MMSATEKVIARLAELKFRVQSDHVELFGETLPLLKALAVDDRAHQLVLVAEQETSAAEDEEDDRRWRELLFAVSGLRHHLRGSAAPALGAPILLAIVDADGAQLLRGLVEKIVKEYALFTRVDINIVDSSEVESGGNDSLDLALAPLLPHVRRAIDDELTVATQDVERFWRELHEEIQATASRLTEAFGGFAVVGVADQIIEELRLNGEPESRRGQRSEPPPRRVSSIRLESFRSFEDDEFELAPVSILHGANGSGKTSVCEALEIIWSGSTQRMPEEGVDPSIYARHLNRGGAAEFSLQYRLGDDPEELRSATGLDGLAAVSLGRIALAQHVLVEMASGAPKERLEAFRKASGLALPELRKERIDSLRRAAFEAANEALEEAGIEPMRAVNSSAIEHLRRILGSSFAAALPVDEELAGASDLLEEATHGARSSSRPVASSEAAKLLADVDASLARVKRGLAEAPDPAPEIKRAQAALREEAGGLREAADPLRLLAQQLSRTASSPAATRKPTAPTNRSPVPPEVAAQWLSQVRGLERSVGMLEGLAADIADVAWRKRLKTYVEGLRAAIDRSHVGELEELASLQDQPQVLPAADMELDPSLLEEAGFKRAPDRSRSVVAAMSEMERQLAGRAARLEELAAEVERHPARAFVSHAARLMPLLFRFEVIRELTNQRGAIARAQETLVAQLLDGRLFPLVRELVAALVRFEWYFLPLKVHSDKQGLHMRGLATDDETHDVRFLLNAAERTVVGIAWFLALHILQPEEDRRVLVLDDPASGFDSMNKATFVATLRAVARLLKPEQLLITTHDDALVALLEQEFASIDEWPAAVGVMCCQRTDSGASEIELEEQEADRLGHADLPGELRKLSFEPKSPSPV